MPLQPTNNTLPCDPDTMISLVNAELQLPSLAEQDKSSYRWPRGGVTFYHHAFGYGDDETWSKYAAIRHKMSKALSHEKRGVAAWTAAVSIIGSMERGLLSKEDCDTLAGEICTLKNGPDGHWERLAIQNLTDGTLLAPPRYAWSSDELPADKRLNAALTDLATWSKWKRDTGESNSSSTSTVLPSRLAFMQPRTRREHNARPGEPGEARGRDSSVGDHPSSYELID